MAIELVGTPTTAFSDVNVSSIDIAVPTGVVNDNVLELRAGCRGAQTINTPAGWTLIAMEATGSLAGDARHYVFRRTALDEPASYTLTASNATRWSVTMIARKGVDLASPEDAAATLRVNSTAVTTHPAAAITTVTDGAVVSCGWTGDATADITSWGDVDLTRLSAIVSSRPGYVGQAVLAAKGASGERSCTTSHAIKSAAITVAWRPAAGTTKTASGVATVAAPGAITATGRKGGRRASATVVGAGVLTATGRKATARTAVVAGRGAITLSTAKGARSSALVAGAGVVTAMARKGTATAVTVAATGVVTALGSSGNKALVTGTGAATATGRKGGTGAPTVTGTGLVTALGRKGAARAPTVVGAGVIAVVARKGSARSATVTGRGVITTRSRKGARSAVTVTGVGRVTAAGGGNKIVTGRGVVTATGRKATGGTATVSGFGVITATGHPQIKEASGSATVTGRGVVLVVGTPAYAPLPLPGTFTRQATYAVVAVDNTGKRLARFPGATIGDVTWTLNEWPTCTVSLPRGAPNIRAVQAVTSELQLYRNGKLLDWFVPLRPHARSKQGPEFRCTGVAWWLSRRHVGRADRKNYLQNPQFEDPLVSDPNLGWAPQAGAVATRQGDYRFLGNWALQLDQTAAGANVFVNQLVATSGAALWTLAAWVHLRADSPTTFAEAFDGRGLFIAAINNAGVVVDQAFAPLSPRNYHEPGGSYRCEVSLSPPSNFAGFLEVRLYAPAGRTVWDAATLTKPEAQNYHQTDQVNIIKGLVAHAQDTAYGKTDERIGSAGVPRGIVRDKRYLHHDHENIWEAIHAFTELDFGPDIDMEVTKTTRTLTVYDPEKGVIRDDVKYRWGSNIIDYDFDQDGTEGASSVVGLGEGDGSDREEGSAVDRSSWGGHALEEVVSLPETPIYLLDAYAKRYLIRRSEVTVGRITVAAEGTIGRVKTGDRIVVEIDDDWLFLEGYWRVVQMVLHPETDTLDLVLNSNVVL